MPFIGRPDDNVYLLFLWLSDLNFIQHERVSKHLGN